MIMKKMVIMMKRERAVEVNDLYTRASIPERSSKHDHGKPAIADKDLFALVFGIVRRSLGFDLGFIGRE